MTLSSPAIAIFAVVVAAAVVIVVGKSSYDGHLHRAQPASSRTQIYVAGLIPLTSDDTDDIDGPAPDVLQAVSMALNDVNRNRHILPYHDLYLDWKDTKCDMAVGSRVFFDMMYYPPFKVLVLGDLCSRVTVPVAESAFWWDILQVSYGDTNPILSDRKKYPNFYRTVPSDADFNLARIRLLQHYGWTRVGTLFQDASSRSARQANMHNKLLELLDSGGFHRETESFSTDPRSALQNIKEKDVRIILGDFDADMAKRVFCAAYSLRMFGAKYQWILAGRYSDDWWQGAQQTVTTIADAAKAEESADNGDEHHCSEETLRLALNGYICADILILSSSRQSTIADMTADEYWRQLQQQRVSSSSLHTSYSKFHGYAYDAVWAIALAVDSVVAERRGRYDAADFRGAGCLLHAALNQTDFVGVTGRVKFNNGDRLGSVVLHQFQDGRMIQIGELNTAMNTFNISDTIRWAGSGPPRDQRVHKLLSVNAVVYAVVCVLAAVGIVVTAIFLAVNIRFRHHRYIKMSSPNMNNIILAGCMLTYSSVFLLGLDGRLVTEQVFPLVCSLKTWVFCVGFTLSFGAMFSKTWRVHAIFTNVQLNKKVIRDYKLIVIVNLLSVIDLVILSTWQIVDPPFRIVKELLPQFKVLDFVRFVAGDRSDSRWTAYDDDDDVTLYVELCASHHLTVWMVAVYTYKGLLLVFGCFLAWETRNVSIAALNDSKYIGLSVYNVVITCAAGVPVSLLVGDRPDSAFLIIALFVVFSTTTTVGLVFGPKLVELRRDPLGEEKKSLKMMRRRTESGSGATARNGSISRRQIVGQLSCENQEFRQLLAEKDDQLEQMLTLLDGSCGEQAEGMCDSVIDGAICRRRDVRPRSDDVMKLARNKSHRTPSNDIELCNIRKVRRSQLASERKTLNVTIAHHYRSTSTSTNTTVIVDDTYTTTATSSASATYSGALLNDDDDASYVHTAGCVKTPSYQGLKFLSDLLQLKETAILSDSEPDLTTLQVDSPDQSSETADVITTL